ncbi:PREDICTED: sodium-dependent glucose transporter 1-like, partial [Dipodomys ordii]|uniref:Sodium-dependent glucose transporter 1-like n=1 Tax=Dipodomys ordii TaxID=10020 RepID=A0A1S3FPN7_DIPOR
MSFPPAAWRECLGVASCLSAPQPASAESQVRSPASPGPACVQPLGEWASGGTSGPEGRELGPWAARAFCGVAKLELEADFRGAGPAGQRPHQDEARAENATKTETVEGSRRSSGGQRLLRWFTTSAVYLAFLGLGMSIAILGPTFQDLATNVNRNISSLLLIFVGQASGFLCG